MDVSGTIFAHPAAAAQAAGDLTSLLAIRRKAARRRHNAHVSRLLGLGLVALALGGLTGPLAPRMTLEGKYALLQAKRTLPGIQRAVRHMTGNVLGAFAYRLNPANPTEHTKDAPVVPALFDPLKTPDGGSIEPINRDFALVIPKIGVNAAVLPSVNPTKPGEYLKALESGIAHSSLSYFPDEDGTVYLFSHSTNYEWFVGDLNAVFYLLKNLDTDDTVVIFYKGTSYTYRITGKQVVKPTAVAYMAPQAGARKLILQTCWPPGSTTERLLIFADLVEEQNKQI